MGYVPLNSKVTNVGPPLTIVGKDLDIGATFNADVASGTGKLRAGRLMTYAAGKLAPSADASALHFGVLADDFDDTGSTVDTPAMVYRTGTFLRQEIESANNFAIPAGGADDVRLNGIGIWLEYSYGAYLGLSPVPPGVSMVPQGSEPAKAPEKETPAAKKLREYQEGTGPI